MRGHLAALELKKQNLNAANKIGGETQSKTTESKKGHETKAAKTGSKMRGSRPYKTVKPKNKI